MNGAVGRSGQWSRPVGGKHAGSRLVCWVALVVFFPRVLLLLVSSWAVGVAL